MMQEQRLTVRLVKYWNQVRKDSRLPSVQHFNPGVVEDLWPYCFQVAVDSQTQKKALFKYEYLGERIIAIYGRDLTGLQVDERMRQFPAATIFKQLRESVEEQTPKENEGFFINEPGKLVKYRICFLPFGVEAKGVTHVIAGLSYRMF